MYRTLSTQERRSREKTTVTLLIDAPLRERLEKMAAASERSLGAEARVAIHKHVARAPDHDDEGDAT